MYPRAPLFRLLFRDERAIPALLKFLEGTRVGGMPGMAPLGAEVDENSLGKIELWPSAGKEGGEDTVDTEDE